MDEFTDYLLSGKNHAKLSPESLEMMGKEAATMFLRDGVSLNDSISKLAAQHDYISPEQVKRVVEFANTAVYLAKHDQDKTAGSDHSYPQFDLADAGRVIQDLSDGARPTVVTNTDVDYNRQIKKVKISSKETEQGLADMFKTASAEKDYSKETIVHEVMSAKETLTALQDNLMDRYNQHESLFKEAASEFYDVLKRHILDGGSFGEAYAATETITGDETKTLLEPIVGRLIQEKVASVSQLKKQLAEGEKLAHGLVDPSHPLIQSYSAMIMSGEDLRTTMTALSEVQSELSDVNTFIKNAFAPAVMAAGRGLLAAGSSMLRSKTLGGSLARNAIGEMKRNPVSTVATAASMVPKKQPAPVPPTNFGG